MKRYEFVWVVCSFVLFVALVTVFGLIGAPGPAAEAGPLPAPTLLVMGWNSQPVYYPVNFWLSKTITSSQASSAFVLAKYETIDSCKQRTGCGVWYQSGKVRLIYEY